MRWAVLAAAAAVIFVVLGALGMPTGWDAAIGTGIAVAFVVIEERYDDRRAARDPRYRRPADRDPDPIAVAKHGALAWLVVVAALLVLAVADFKPAGWVALAALVYIFAVIPLWVLLYRGHRD